MLRLLPRIAKQTTKHLLQPKKTLNKPFLRWHSGTPDIDPNATLVTMTFIEPSTGKRHVVTEPEGTNMLIAAHRNEIDLEGACECSLACSTCHIIVKDEKVFDMLPEPTEEEEDMLDLAFGLEETSRLGCQVILTPEIDGIEVVLPTATRNMAVDGFKPKPH